MYTLPKIITVQQFFHGSKTSPHIYSHLVFKYEKYSNVAVVATLTSKQ